MQCAILIGGLGTRLGSLVKDCPKPMLPVGGRPFLDTLIENLARFGFDDIVLLAGYRADVVETYVRSDDNAAARLGVRLSLVVEPTPLGTGGALANARDHLAEEFLMINGDSFLDFNLLDLVTLPFEGDWLGKMALRKVEDASRYGVVSLGQGGRISAMQERPDPSALGKPGVINGGIYWLKRGIIDAIPAGAASIERDVFPALAKRGLLFGRQYDGFFLDIGVPDDYAAAQSLLPRHRPAVFFDRDGVLNHDAGYTHRIEDFRWIDGAVDAIRAANDANWFVFVVTNQAGVARGLYDEAQVAALHRWMNERLREKGAHIDDFRFCPHHPDGVIELYAKPCPWRKPNPGMIVDLLERWPVDKARSILIGDKTHDVEAAKAAGVASILFEGAGSFSELKTKFVKAV